MCVPNTFPLVLAVYILTVTWLICCCHLQTIMILSILMFVVYYWKRSKWTVLKSRKIVYYDKGL